MNTPNVLHRSPAASQQASSPTSAGALIHEFLRQKRIAIVGVSRDQRNFSRSVFNEFRKRGYDVVPCNPHESQIGEVQSFPTVLDIQPPVDAVLIMTSPTITEAAVRDCEQAGITRIWIHKGIGLGAESDPAVAFCHEHNMKVISGFCPLMFLAKTPVVHRIHGLFKRLNGTYPH